MKKKIGRFLSVLLTLAMLAGVVTTAPMSASAADANGKIYPSTVEGACGDDAMFYCFPDGSMAMFGTSDIWDYELTANGASTAPWYSQMDVMQYTLFINKIAIEYGITGIGDYCFYFPDGNVDYTYSYYRMIAQLYNVDIANTVTRIGKYAFYNQKMEHITIPPTVTTIGVNAFQKSDLKDITYFGDPSTLEWGGMNDASDSEFPKSKYPNGITCHILEDYKSSVAEFNTRFANKNIKFSADMSNPYAIADNKERNIAAYYGSTNSKVFGGAAPFIIVGKFDGIKKSVTHGSCGFVSCLKQGNDYYVLTDNTTGSLNYANRDNTSGKITGYTTPHSALKLNITHEYIGPNIVKMIYTLKNDSASAISGLQLGGTGDIKIGADDLAAIEPLTENGQQVGFYMKSHDADYDKQSGNYATLGFIGKNVKIDQSLNTPENISPAASFFYGAVGTNKSNSYTGTKSMLLIPERIFVSNNNVTQSSGSFNTNNTVDSGMSYHWDDITVPANSEKKFAVLFSVYGSSTDETAQSLIEEGAKQEDQFVEITWNIDGNVVKQIVNSGETPVYPGATPVKESGFSDENEYVFSGWSPKIGTVTADTSYTAQFTTQRKHEKLFVGHSLTLEGDIGIYFYLNKSEIERAPVGRKVEVHIERLVKGETKSVDCTFNVGDEDYIVNRDGTDYYRVKCNVPAPEMSYINHASAKINGEMHWDRDAYSVRQYGMDILNSASSSAALKTLAEEMLNYGAKAQIVFDRLDAPLANVDVKNYTPDSGVTETSFDAAVSAEAKNAGKEKSNMRSGTSDFGLTYRGSSVVFLTKTSLRHYYTINNQASYATTYTANSESKTFAEKDPFIYSEFTDIPAKELDVLQEMTVGSHTYYFSVLDYAKAMFKDGNQDEHNLGLATYLYNRAANAYFVN